MSAANGHSSFENSESELYEILKNCVTFQSYDSLPIVDYNDVCSNTLCNYFKMISTNSYSASGTISTSSFASDESFGESILEENGRISLAYENLRTIPRRIAEKFAAQTKLLDLSYNNFQNLSFLSFFEELHTLILDRNTRLNVNTLPYLPSLRILWINNCDISNVNDWIQRIQLQCPCIEQLSVMGNPGVKNLLNYCTLTSHCLMDPNIPTPIVNNYREYILHALPTLEYLDGVARNAQSMLTSTPNHTNGKISSSPSAGNGQADDSHNSALEKTHKASPSLSFKDLFRLKRRKKSYQSSSTN